MSTMKNGKMVLRMVTEFREEKGDSYIESISKLYLLGILGATLSKLLFIIIN